MNYSQTIKLLPRFRFISVFYGELFESFLGEGGEALESNKGR